MISTVTTTTTTVTTEQVVGLDAPLDIKGKTSK
jgi:hypothetical protein